MQGQDDPGNIPGQSTSFGAGLNLIGFERDSWKPGVAYESMWKGRRLRDVPARGRDGNRQSEAGQIFHLRRIACTRIGSARDPKYHPARSNDHCAAETLAQQLQRRDGSKLGKCEGKMVSNGGEISHRLSSGQMAKDAAGELISITDAVTPTDNRTGRWQYTVQIGLPTPTACLRQSPPPNSGEARKG